MFKAEIVADSLSPQGDRLISILCTFPRIILAEVNTHRMLSKNTSSSRAIPFKKMVQSVKDNPFIPIAWQKDHSGMQGSEYLNPDKKVTLDEFIVILYDTLNTYPKDSKEYVLLEAKIKERVELVETILVDYKNKVKSLIDWWLFARDKAVECATILYVLNVTKQLCNRLLETFMWTTMLITGSLEGGWDNFFNLRCPQYILPRAASVDMRFKSWKDVIKHNEEITSSNPEHVDRIAGAKWLNEFSVLDRLKQNTGQAEIHMMYLAELIYDTVNESIPKQLKAGEWHIPFDNKIISILSDVNSGNRSTGIQWLRDKIKISTAMGARTSYTIVGDEKEVKWGDLYTLDDKLLIQQPPHSSPMEHCSRAMDDKEYVSTSKGKRPDVVVQGTIEEIKDVIELGWCRNYRGFIQRRHLIEETFKS